MPPAKDFGESDEEAEKGPNVAKNHLKRERRGPSQTEVEDQGSWLGSTPKGACMYICSRERPGERGYWRMGCKGLISYVAFQDLEFKRPSLTPVHGEIPNSYYHYLDIILFKRQRRATYSKYTEFDGGTSDEKCFVHTCTYNTYLVTSLSRYLYIQARRCLSPAHVGNLFQRSTWGQVLSLVPSRDGL